MERNPPPQPIILVAAAAAAPPPPSLLSSTTMAPPHPPPAPSRTPAIPAPTSAVATAAATIAAPTSAYDVFGVVDQLVSKGPILGSDGAAAWQAFRKDKGSTGGALPTSSSSSVAPRAPLKKSDRLAFATWDDERKHEEETRRKAGVSDLSEAGYTHFRKKVQQQQQQEQQDEATAKEVAKEDGTALTQRRRLPDDDTDTSSTFVPADTFQGARDGYVYTTRDRGTGYYRDDGLLEGQRPRPLEKQSTLEVSSYHTVAADASFVKKRTESKKRKTPGPVIVDDPNNPLEQVAAALQRRNGTGMMLAAPLQSLPLGWEAAVDPSTGRTYYFQRATGERRSRRN